MTKSFSLLIFLFFIICNNAANSQEQYYLKSQKLNDYFKRFGKPVKTFKNIYQFKSKNINLILYLEKNKVTKAEYKFFKSTYYLSDHKEELKNLKMIQPSGHEQGNSFYLVGKNIKYEFNNNRKKNLKSLELSW